MRPLKSERAQLEQYGEPSLKDTVSSDFQLKIFQTIHFDLFFSSLTSPRFSPPPYPPVLCSFSLTQENRLPRNKNKNKQQEITRNIKAPQKHETENQSRAGISKHTGRALGDKCTPLIPNQAPHDEERGERMLLAAQLSSHPHFG